MPAFSSQTFTRHDSTRTRLSANVLATRSGNAWNFVQNPRCSPSLTMLGTNTTSHAPASKSGATCPRYAFEARQHSSLDSASPRSTTALSVGSLTATSYPSAWKNVVHSTP